MECAGASRGIVRAMSWLPLPAAASDADPFEQVFALRANLFEAWRDFTRQFWTRRLVDPCLLELCRLRIAALNGAAHPQRAAQRRRHAVFLPHAVSSFYPPPGCYCIAPARAVDRPGAAG